jgi:single-strand DNA-binding protein
MNGLNKTIIVGNLGRDPELKYTNVGVAFLKLSLAVNERRKDKSGEWGDHVEWINAVVWNKRAEGLSKFVTKGSTVCVEGKIRTRSWEGDDGKKRYMTEIAADNVIVMGGGKGNIREDDAPAESDAAGRDGFEDEIPF